MTNKNRAIGMSAELDMGYVNRWRYAECERIQYIHTEKSRGLGWQYHHHLYSPLSGK